MTKGEGLAKPEQPSGGAGAGLLATAFDLAGDLAPEILPLMSSISAKRAAQRKAFSCALVVQVARLA